VYISAFISNNYEKGELTHMSELLTVSEVAEILRVDDTTVRRWVKQGALEAIILPHVNERQAYRIKRETLEKLLGSNSSVEQLTHA
jgi:excisionase family DNA binding protein